MSIYNFDSVSVLFIFYINFFYFKTSYYLCTSFGCIVSCTPFGKQ